MTVLLGSDCYIILFEQILGALKFQSWEVLTPLAPSSTTTDFINEPLKVYPCISFIHYGTNIFAML